MNDLIKFENGELQAEVIKKIITLETQKKAITEECENIKAQILEAMETNGIQKFECDELTITHVDAGTSERFDSKALKEELPDIYDQYVKITPVKSSIRVKIK